MNEYQRLTRSLTERVFGGVCGGIAAYTGINALWLRSIFIIIAPTTQGFGILLYIVLWLTLPVETLDDLPPLAPVGPSDGDGEAAGVTPPRPPSTGTGQLALGLVAMALGAVLFLLGADVLPVASRDLFWPVAALAIGGALLWRHFRGV